VNNLSQVNSKKLHTTDPNQNRHTLLSQSIACSDTNQLSKANSDSINFNSLAVNWSKKYYSLVVASKNQTRGIILQNPLSIHRPENKSQIVEKLSDTLKVASEIAWRKVEAILGEEIECHGIDSRLINPVEIVSNTRQLYSKAIDAYGDLESVSRLSVLVGRPIIELRRKYSQLDPLVLGFVTLEFQLTQKILLGCLSELERTQFSPYLKIVDDYLHIPYGEINQAAANLPTNSQALLAVQHLLPHTTQIANAVYDRATSHHQGYRSSSGYLTDEDVKISGIRDIEIFQNYLCWCVLEDSFRPVQQELFPICVMLYPKLHVSWELVQDMLLILFWEISDRLAAEDLIVFLPYLRTVTEMFSSDVFEN
jgi:hypothetical protein